MKETFEGLARWKTILRGIEREIDRAADLQRRTIGTPEYQRSGVHKAELTGARRRFLLFGLHQMLLEMPDDIFLRLTGLKMGLWIEPPFTPTEARGEIQQVIDIADWFATSLAEADRGATLASGHAEAEWQGRASVYRQVLDDITTSGFHRAGCHLRQLGAWIDDLLEAVGHENDQPDYAQRERIRPIVNGMAKGHREASQQVGSALLHLR